MKMKPKAFVKLVTKDVLSVMMLLTLNVVLVTIHTFSTDLLVYHVMNVLQ
jgi:hypothetical protein